ncbi:hypothetical protein FEM48_Zijuj07G0154500 [Ziziphus jujuba var. spinosa]|uniref:Ataxin-10 domain-containing protein n=1 Tax=Ziziphus jujuba var. spinosa TaxID=714518 RepID=A0A978V5F5_ZIZJJ|nr:hypothetical protein FEM48_Zijuj07G0154500 [Ziziphus jujuba var. spinosa]
MNSLPLIRGQATEDSMRVELYIGEDVLQALYSASNSSTLQKSMELLIETSRTEIVRAELASKQMVPLVIRLIQSLPYPAASQYLALSLKLLRNLCAGEIANMNSFIQHNGVEVILNVLRSARLCSEHTEPDYGIIRFGLQTLANVSWGGQGQLPIWRHFFPQEFLALAELQRREVCDPLCMIIYTCCDGNPELLKELCSESGLPIAGEIVRTAAAAVGFGEDWLKLLLSKICLEEPHFPVLFSKLSHVGAGTKDEDAEVENGIFSTEQAFLLKIVSEILNERLEDIAVRNDFALCVLAIFKRSFEVVIGCGMRGKSGLPTGFTAIDVLGYSLTILRDICAVEGQRSSEEEPVDADDMLLSSGLVELLLCVLRSLEPPTIIKKAIKQSENQEGTNSSCSLKPCPYRGFRRDIVAVIGNCTYRRKRVQDEIRQKNGILLLLQQCVADEENPFLREWGIWSVRNLLEGNAENQQNVAELELQGSVEVPELAGLGLRVEVDPETRRAKLVNIS